MRLTQLQQTAADWVAFAPKTVLNTKNNILVVFFPGLEEKNCADSVWVWTSTDSLYNKVEWRKQRLLQLFAVKNVGWTLLKNADLPPRKAAQCCCSSRSPGLNGQGAEKCSYELLPWRQLKSSLVILNLTDSLSPAEQLSQPDSWSSFSALCSSIKSHNK